MHSFYRNTYEIYKMHRKTIYWTNKRCEMKAFSNLFILVRNAHLDLIYLLYLAVIFNKKEKK